MKKMKLVFIGLLTLALAACSPASEEAGEVSEEVVEQDDETTKVESEDEVAGGEGVITFATNANFPPYEFYEGDKIVGIDVEIGQAIADKLGIEMQIQDMAFTNIIASVNSGKVDAGFGGITKTPDREKSVRFSDTYATAVQSIVVKEEADVDGPADLEGLSIGTQVGTTGDMQAQADFGVEYVQSFDNSADAVLALMNGKVDAVIIDSDPAENFVKVNQGLRIVGTEYFVEEYGFIFNLNDDELFEKANNALKELIADGTVEKIIEKYKSAE